MEAKTTSGSGPTRIVQQEPRCVDESSSHGRRRDLWRRHRGFVTSKPVTPGLSASHCKTLWYRDVIPNWDDMGTGLRNGKTAVRKNDHLKPNSITLAGSELVRSQIPLRCLDRTIFEPAPNQLRTGSKPDSVMEFGREPASSC